jgi:hypothetical protein
MTSLRSSSPTWAATEFGNTLLTLEALEYDPDLLLRGKLATGSTPDLSYNRFRAAALFGTHNVSFHQSLSYKTAP